MKSIRVAIIGWGNVGRHCKYVIDETADMELAGVVRRASSLGAVDEDLSGVKVVSDIKELGKIDIALVCVPSKLAGDRVAEILKMGISTVDSFDIHTKIVQTKRRLNSIAKQNNAVSIFGAGWDPGSDSVVRCLMQIVCPHSLTTTTFGGTNGGRSMGHTAAVKSIEGVQNAVSLTLPNGPGRQKRLVYIELKPKADFNAVADAIRKDDYFKNDPTDVVAVDDVSKYDTLNHGGEIERLSNDVVQNYKIEGINPLMTANVLVASARAAYRTKKAKRFGAYTMIEIPLIDFVPGTFEDQLKGY
ncbi:MAG: diaminopimelate dehydrogenase [Alphaproteobacteria bacterium]|nr:diaminopimelate dehydrogenase [Alphaproteobacteria bacterium]